MFWEFTILPEFLELCFTHLLKTNENEKNPRLFDPIDLRYRWLFIKIFFSPWHFITMWILNVLLLVCCSGLQIVQIIVHIFLFKSKLEHTLAVIIFHLLCRIPLNFISLHNFCGKLQIECSTEAKKFQVQSDIFNNGVVCVFFFFHSI